MKAVLLKIEKRLATLQSMGVPFGKVDADLLDEVRAALASLPAVEAQPVAWALFAKFGNEWVIQFPVDDSEEHANAQRKMYEARAVLECRPLYASPQVQGESDARRLSNIVQDKGAAGYVPEILGAKGQP